MRFAVVFDTSVLLSAIGWGRKPGRCLELARDGSVDAFTCREILRELSAKLALKAHFSDQQIAEVLAAIQQFLRPITISGTMTGLCADPKDDMVLECALLAEATHVVSSDKKHLLALKQFRGISIASPAEFLEAVEVAG